MRVPREVIREVGDGHGFALWLKAIQPSVLINPVRQVAVLAAELQGEYAALTEGFQGHASADAWIIATAKHHTWWVACEESSGLPNKKKMPDVCEERDVEFVRTLEMLKALDVKVCATCL